jgi:hypothetical protein
MTQKIYRTARGKTVDMGALMLQNEKVRAVGNMDVNARGDRIDANGNVIDSKNRQIQRQVHRQTSAAPTENFSSTQAVRQAQAAKALTDMPKAPVAPTVADLIPGIDAVAASAPTEAAEATETTQGLAGALVRAKKNKEVKPTEEL